MEQLLLHGYSAQRFAVFSLFEYSFWTGVWNLHFASNSLRLKLAEELLKAVESTDS